MMEWRHIEEKWAEMAIRLQATSPKPKVAPKSTLPANPPVQDPADNAPVFDPSSTRAMA